MTRAFEEKERPSEWLRGLNEKAAGYAELVREAGEPVVAAYRIASARCRTRETSATIPTLRELHAAILEVWKEAEVSTPLPSRTVIARECDHMGLTVIGA